MAGTARESSDALYFLPLGGAGEIGMNLNLYGLAGEAGTKWLMADLGLTFADESLPGVDLVLPDPAWIVERRDDLLALVLTHAHEDHLGAVPYLWARLRCPIYASPFAAAVLRRKLDEVDLLDEVPLHVIDDERPFDLGPFRVSMIAITHSIPEAKALAIETALGTVVHSGDWKLDPTPLVGPTFDATAFEAWGDKGVLALVCDSTNVLRPGESGSEAAVRESLNRLVDGCTGRVAITTFASNVARIETAARVAAAHDRHLVVVGRSLWRIVEAARECGYLDDIGPMLGEREAGYLPPDKVLLLCTGCQGEPRGAMARIADGSHPQVELAAGDLVIFSCKIIPGNERTVGRVHNQLAAAGVEVITERDHFVHVSGHPSQDELARFYGWIRPKIAVPVHGEALHLHRHAALARQWGAADAVELRNGALLRLAPGRPEVVDWVPAGRLAVDGGRLVAVDSEVLRARRRMMYNGVAQVTLVVDREGRPVDPPRIALQGVIDGAGEPALVIEAAAAIDAALDELRPAARADDAALAEAARRALRRLVRQACGGRRPVTEVQVVRLPAAGVDAAEIAKEAAS